MPRFILRFFAPAILCAAGAFGQAPRDAPPVLQGTFGQIVFGGPWQTTFTLINMSSTSAATVTLSFFGDNGAPLTAPVQGSTDTSVYVFTIPMGGAQNVVLPSSLPTDPTTQGWASMSTTGTVRGQGSFRFQLPGGTISEAVVPLSIPNPTLCILPLPPVNVILVPFDNTGQYATSLALANTTNASLAITFEFYDQSNNQLRADALNLTAMQHMAFLTTQNYPELAGKKGILRIHADPAKLTVLGLLSNASNVITTIIPITQ